MGKGRPFAEAPCYLGGGGTTPYTPKQMEARPTTGADTLQKAGGALRSFTGLFEVGPAYSQGY